MIQQFIPQLINPLYSGGPYQLTVLDPPSSQLVYGYRDNKREEMNLFMYID